MGSLFLALLFFPFFLFPGEYDSFPVKEGHCGNESTKGEDVSAAGIKCSRGDKADLIYQCSLRVDLGF